MKRHGLGVPSTIEHNPTYIIQGVKVDFPKVSAVILCLYAEQHGFPHRAHAHDTVTPLFLADLASQFLSLNPNPFFNMTTNGDSGPVGEEKINTNIITLTSFLTEEQTKHKEATGDFT